MDTMLGFVQLLHIFFKMCYIELLILCPYFFLVSHDCGVFTMRSVEVFDPTKDLRKEFSKDDVLHLRIQYANRLFFHSGNTVDHSIVTNYYVKVTFFLHFSLSH
jgi:hypothetical protein